MGNCEHKLFGLKVIEIQNNDLIFSTSISSKD